MPRGGKRPGAGRPKGRKDAKTLERELARAYLSERTRAELEPLATALLETGKGAFHFLAKTDDGWMRVTDAATIDRLLASGEAFYRIAAKDPDVRALQQILDREFGRPKEHMTVSDPDGGPVRVRFVDA